MRRLATKNYVFLAILGTWGALFRLFDFPLLPIAPFLKFDLSDLIGLIGLLTNGPIGLMIVSGIRELLNFLIKGGQFGIPIGEFMSFFGTLALFLPTHLIIKASERYRFARKKCFYSTLIIILSTISLTISMATLNYYIALPLYIKLMQFPISSFNWYIYSIIVPFNLIKGLLIGFGQIIILYYMVPILQKRRLNYYNINLI